MKHILDKLEKVRKSGKGYVACCPAHGDKSPSLSIKEGDNGYILLHCFAGCEPDEVLAAIGLGWADVMPEDGEVKRDTKKGFSLKDIEEDLWHILLVINHESRIDYNAKMKYKAAASRVHFVVSSGDGWMFDAAIIKSLSQENIDRGVSAALNFATQRLNLSTQTYKNREFRSV